MKLFENRDKPLRLLHFAPERFFYKLFSNYEMIEYTPCDLFPEIYDYGGKIKVKKVDITQIPFDDQSFDLILCNHVLEHIPDDLRAMSELYRVLSNNGQGIFQVPLDYSKNHTYEDFKITDPKERKIAFGQHDHVRIYGKDYKDSLEKVGFNVEVNDFINQFTKAEKFKYGILKSELIYYCGKH
ncbi:MAG: class I SAM-dependent methyltransferase [Fulvivirga sp.]|uniref:class I SAM-dependent methyltransferase n=1 Tax=Fulvivirga sp. TaxID=1931237 RepID=UPI0032EE96ED